MIAYLEKHDTTVEVPDDIGDKGLSDINENFHSYVEQKQPTEAISPGKINPETPSGQPDSAQAAAAPLPLPKWQPNFYESLVKPALSAVSPVIYPLAEAAVQLPGAPAFAGKAVEEGTFGLAKPLTDPLFAEDYKDHPAFASAGQVAGGLGSLLITGGALGVAGLGTGAALAGKTAVEAGFAAGERFIPRAIMTGATFGTRTFIAETVKAFEEGGVNLTQFGEHVLKDTAFGAMFGSIGGLTNAAASVSSAGALGFISSKMDGGDNREASLNAAIWAAFETVGSVGRTTELRLEALRNLKGSIGEYVGERNPGLEDKDAARVASQFVDHAVRRAGFENAEDLAKSGPANLLEGIEKVNQAVRTAKIPHPGPQSEPLLPKLPAPAEPLSAAAPQAPEPVPQTPMEKIIDSVKGMFGVKPEPPAEASPQTTLAQGNRTYEEKMSDLKAQGHDISRIPESAFPEDLKDVYHYEQGKTENADITKSVSAISGRLNALGVNPDEQSAIFDQYDLQKTGAFGQPTIGSDLIHAPIEAQYRTAYLALAAQRGIDKGSALIPANSIVVQLRDYDGNTIGSISVPHDGTDEGIKKAAQKAESKINESDASGIQSRIGVTDENGKVTHVISPNLKHIEPIGTKSADYILGKESAFGKSEKFDSRTMEDAIKAVDLINGYFSPKSQNVLEFAKQHPEASDHDVAQMAHDRGLLEEPNPDLLKMEIQKSRQEHIPGPTQSERRALYESDLERFQVWRDVIGVGIRPPKTGERDEYKSLPLWMRNSAGRPYDEIAQNAEEMGLIRPGEDIFSTLRAVHKPSASYSLISTSKESALTRYERLIKQATDKGFNPLQAQKWARSQLTGKVEASGPEIESVQKEFGAEGGIKSFGRGKKGESELFDAQIAVPAPFPGIAIPKERRPPVSVIPEEVSSRLKESADEITNLVNPANAAPLAAQITRENLGKMARSYDMAEASLSQAKALFDGQSKEENLAFIDRLERGEAQKDPKMNEISGVLRKLMDDKRKEIQALGTGKMESFIENYFPHIWDQGESQVGQAVMKAAKRPFEGSKGFLKKRSIEFTKDGIAMGLTPVSYNPVDLALLKIREMDKYLAAHRTIQEYKASGLAQYVKIGGEVPEGWTKIDDRISTIFKSPMVAVKEAYDAKMMEDLTGVAKSLGVDLERSERIKGEGRKFPGELWGLSQSNAEGEPGKVSTRFAGPESVLAHELGHQIDHMYGLGGKFLSDAKIDEELTNLAQERLDVKSTAGFKKYIQEPNEKMAVMMEAYIHAPELLKKIAPYTFKKLEDFLKSDAKLEPLTAIKPSLVLGTNEGQVYAGGSVIAGHIYAQPDAARIINNYLSPGLQKSGIYQAYRYAGNMVNQFQLGFSAFHLGFTSLDASVSKFALALNELAAGHPIKAAKDVLETPFAPIQNIIRGNDLLKAWRGQGKSGIDDILAELMASAGGRARMDQFYATKAYDQMKHHFEAGNLVRGILHIPLTVADLASKPILEWIVPRQKLGVFADIMKMETENHPDMSHADMRVIAQKAWDSVDNRMGQLVYDNLFWNRTFKDLLMASVRSVGWNLGTVRELVGGGADYAEAIRDAARGKKPEFTYRMAYFAALPIVTGMLGAIIQYLRTGKGPQEIKDYWFPKTGGVDSHGYPSRVSLPSYMKDLYHYTQAPISTITNKLSPILASLRQMMENKDYYGTKIRNEDDPLTKQVLSEATFMLKQVTPFSIRNMQRNLETGNKSLFDTVGPWVGITPAPYDINQTKAEKMAHEIAASHQEIGGRTQDQADRSKLVSDLTRQYRMGDPKATDHLYEAYQQGLISHRQMQTVIVHSTMTPLQRMVNGFTLPETERVYAKANDEEKAQIERIMRKKQASQESAFVAQ